MQSNLNSKVRKTAQRKFRTYKQEEVAGSRVYEKHFKGRNVRVLRDLKRDIWENELD